VPILLDWFVGDPPGVRRCTLIDRVKLASHLVTGEELGAAMKYVGLRSGLLFATNLQLAALADLLELPPSPPQSGRR
jgi:hypothetical protein